jgi:hypothetical protein
VPFIGAVKLKPGYNMQVSILAATKLVTLDAVVNKGEGMQCQDLRMDETGALVPNACLDCGNLVYAINGFGYDAEHIQFVGDKGVVVIPDPVHHSVTIRLEEDGICRVDV